MSISLGDVNNYKNVRGDNMKYVKWNDDIFLHTKNEKNQDVLSETLDDGFKITYIFEGTKPISQINKELLSILIK